jgi:hypothetical protein
MQNHQEPIELSGNVSDKPHLETLGTVRLRHETTNELILVAKPSEDPDDPLNW